MYIYIYMINLGILYVYSMFQSVSKMASAESNNGPNRPSCPGEWHPSHPCSCPGELFFGGAGGKIFRLPLVGLLWFTP